MTPKNGITVAAVLLDHGADVNSGTRDSLPPLIRAIDRCNLKMVRFLLERGALIEAEDSGLYNGVLSTFALPGFRGIYLFDNAVDILKVHVSLYASLGFFCNVIVTYC